MFIKIDATEYLDDLWGRDGPHMYIHITKFKEVIISCNYVCLYIYACKMHWHINIQAHVSTHMHTGSHA